MIPAPWSPEPRGIDSSGRSGGASCVLVVSLYAYRWLSHGLKNKSVKRSSSLSPPQRTAAENLHPGISSLQLIRLADFSLYASDALPYCFDTSVQYTRIAVLCYWLRHNDGKYTFWAPLSSIHSGRFELRSPRTVHLNRLLVWHEGIIWEWVCCRQAAGPDYSEVVSRVSTPGGPESLALKRRCSQVPAEDCKPVLLCFKQQRP